ncbi:MAG: hypothetical protein ABIJ09_16225 [Pseudomonadota bacterium]
MLLDLSAGGVFVGPAIGWQDEHFIRNTPFARVAHIGDEIVLSYREAWYAAEILTIAVLRWFGFSPVHQCYGFGFEFQRDDADLATVGPGVTN